MLVTHLRAGAAGLLLMTVLAACSGGAAPSGVATLQSPGAGETRPVGVAIGLARPRDGPPGVRPLHARATASTCPTPAAAAAGR